MAAAVFAGATLACGSSAPPPAPAPDGGDAQRLVALLDYVAGDYGLNIRDGVVVDPAEYDEHVKFVDEARGMGDRLLAGSPADPLRASLEQVARAVRDKGRPEVVAAACRQTRAAVVARFGLRTTPFSRPSLPRAEALYAQNCAVCHGPTGEADTERARTLNPRPARFREPGRLAAMSPYRVFNALTFGVPGTAMASFDSLTPEERWDLGFYVFRLGHTPTRSDGPIAISLTEMATESDDEILARLRARPGAEPQAGLTWVRREAAFIEPPAGAGIDRTRHLLGRAQAAFEKGRAADADRQVLDAYLECFEPIEPGLRVRDAAATAEVEAGFRELRAALARGDAAPAVRARYSALDTRLAELAGGQRPAIPFAAAFLIYVREGIEAALLVAALLAGLRRVGRADAARWVHAGWLAAVPAGIATFFVVDRLISLSAARREVMEAALALLAAAVLFSVSFWMISRAESRHWMGYLKRGVAQSLSRHNLALLAGLAFLAVYREAAETILFTQALLMEVPRRTEVFAGAAVGLGVVLVLAFGLNRAVVRLPLGPFFAVSGVLLCGLAVSFAGAGVYGLVEAGTLRPRPVPVPEVAWMGIHPDLTSLLVQTTIVVVIAWSGLLALRRAQHAPPGA